jgi:DNA-binding transcriptional MocR family regulator
MASSDLVSQKEAAAILNRSVSAVSRAIKDGRLEYADPKNRLLRRPGLEQRFARKTRPRIDAPQRKAQIKPKRPGLEAQSVPRGYWQRLSDKLEFSLGAGPAYWQEPSNPQRLRLFVQTLDELRRQVEMEGCSLNSLSKDFDASVLISWQQ